MAFDYYRSATNYRLQGAVTDGKLVSWKTLLRCSRDDENPNYAAGYRAFDFPGKVIPNVAIEQTLFKSETPTGPWRAPISNVYAFADSRSLPSSPTKQALTIKLSCLTPLVIRAGSRKVTFRA